MAGEEGGNLLRDDGIHLGMCSVHDAPYLPGIKHFFQPRRILFREFVKESRLREIVFREGVIRVLLYAARFTREIGNVNLLSLFFGSFVIDILQDGNRVGAEEVTVTRPFRLEE